MKHEKSVYTPAYRVLLDTLKESRQRAGMTQRDLAREMGVPPSWVAKVEIGERRLDLIEVLRITTILNCNPTKLIRKIKAKMDETASTKRG